MSERTYASIEHLVAEQHQDTDILEVVFRCPESGREVKADALLESKETVGTVARDAAKREASWGVFRWVADAVSSLLGGGVAGSVAGSIGGDIASDQVSSRGNYLYSADEKQAAVLEAFGSVEEEFVFDEAARQWAMRAH